jgi:hypothetical protein
MGKFKEMDLLRQEREAFDADYPMEPTPMADMWVAWNSEDGFTFWDNEQQAILWSADTYLSEWPVQYVMQKVQPASWVGLTDEERNKIRFDYLDYDERARALEAKLKEKNRG